MTREPFSRLCGGAVLKRLASYGLGALALILPDAAAAQASRVTLRSAPMVSADDYPERAIMTQAEGSLAVDNAVDPKRWPTTTTTSSANRPAAVWARLARVWTPMCGSMRVDHHAG